jgi:hypothetical protein
MYFVDDHHAVNYKLTQLQWEFAQNDPEYAAACYLLAVPWKILSKQRTKK